jgi:hypothetical protein
MWHVMILKTNHSIWLVHIIYGNYIVYHPLEGCDEITRGEKYNHLGDGPRAKTLESPTESRNQRESQLFTPYIE